MRMRLAIPVVCVFWFFSSVNCAVHAGHSVRGSGHVIKKTHKLSGFTGVELASMGDLHIEKGRREELRVEAEDNLHEYFEFEVSKGMLEIRTRRHVSLRPREPVNFYLTVRDLDTILLSGCGDIDAPDLEGKRIKISISGAGDVETGDLEAESIVLKISGAGDLTVSGGEAEDLHVSISGAGDVEIDDIDARMVELKITGAGNAVISGGTADRQDIIISGAGDYRARGLRSDQADVVVSGCGSATIHVRDRLVARISGSGDVRYAGSPRVRASVSGSGDLEQI